MGIAKKVIGELTFDLKRLQKDAKTVEAITKEISGYGRRTSTKFKELGRVIDSSMGRVANQYRQHYRNIDNVARTGSRGIVTITKQGHQQVIQDTRTFGRQIETEYKKTNDRINQIARTTAGKPLGVGTKKQQYDNLLKSLGYRADWFVSGAIFYGSIRASNKLLDVISDTEQGMINLQKVMQDQSTDFDKLQNDLMNLGQAYGRFQFLIGRLKAGVRHRGGDTAHVSIPYRKAESGSAAARRRQESESFNSL